MDDNEHHCRNNKDGLDDNIHHQFQENNESIQACKDIFLHHRHFLAFFELCPFQELSSHHLFWKQVISSLDPLNLFGENVLGEFSHKYFHKILILPEISSGLWVSLVLKFEHEPPSAIKIDNYVFDESFILPEGFSKLKELEFWIIMMTKINTNLKNIILEQCSTLNWLEWHDIW